MDTTVLMEIENMRRASMAGLREKYREVFGEETHCRHRSHCPCVLTPSCCGCHPALTFRPIKMINPAYRIEKAP